MHVQRMYVCMYVHTYNTCMYMYVNYQAMHTQAFITQIDSC